jgi:gliding motility-associated-like protein
MRVPSLIVGLFLIVHPASAQNLVKNGSFESYYNPPINNQVLLEDFVKDWSSYITTPDYYSTILWSPSGVQNYCGTLPRTGSGMVGGYQLGYFPSNGYNREYIQGELTDTLKAGKMYYAEVYVKPMVKSPVISWAIKNIGFALTDKNYTTIPSAPQFLIPESPEVEYQSSVITDLTNWTKISGCFIAKGGETKIIIGNFQKDENTDAQKIGSGNSSYDLSYYLLDDVSVTEIGTVSITPDTTICAGKTVTLTAFYPGASSYLWNTGATTSSINVSSAGNYSVQISIPGGCDVSASVIVTVRNCEIVDPPLPNPSPIPVCPPLMLADAFTPNGDGRNDQFRIINRESIQLVELSIYNRWGEKVFSTSNINTGWDGTYKGEPGEIGTYGYQLWYRDCHNGSVLYKKGDVTLIR